ncbi:MAG: hypothetical protein JNL63_03615 [Bacteroidia bacterium]|nr:hypothetical protein [Bacteroidia bacterium]
MKIENYFLTKLFYGIVVSIISIISSAKAQQSNATDNAETAKKTDTVSYIVKYKIKSITTFTYRSNDSTLNDVKLESKQKITYDKAGNYIGDLSENGTGKIISRSESTYDSRNNMVESISYDSLNKISYSSKYYYDDLNRLFESSTSQPLNLYTYKPEDAGKYSTYTYRSKYDANGNVIEYTNDSSGTIVSKTLARFDIKNRTVYTAQYDHTTLQSTTTYLYDSKGAYTLTIEYYQTASRTQCSPSKNRTIEKFDERGNMISSVSSTEENGVKSTTKTTYEYKYDKDKLLLLKTVVESNGDGYASKSTSLQLNKYDKNGNLIESFSKYAGGGGNYTTKYKYNNNNSLIEQVSYNNNCMDKPTTIATYVYFPDSVTLKESSSVTFDYPSKYIDRYDERSLNMESMSISQNGSSHTVYQYEYWE